MRRRIVFAILTVTTAAITLFGVPLAVVVERFVDNDAVTQLERRAILAGREVSSEDMASGDPVELPAGPGGSSFALYDPAGRRVAGVGPAQADATTQAALANQVTDVERSGQRIVAVPLTANEAVIGAIRAEQPTAASQRRSWRIAGLLGLLALGVLGIGTVIAFVVAGRLSRPVARLSEAARRLGEGDFTVEVPATGVAELDQAGLALGVTARRLDDLVRRERAFSADVSHQLRTPLAGLRAAIETELAFPRDDRTEVLREALGDLDRLERTVTELLALARNSSAEPSTADLNAVLAGLRAAWHGPLAAVGRNLVIGDPGQLPPVAGTEALVRHALDVLLDNALSHGGGEVRVQVITADDTVAVSVTDEGPGFPAHWDLRTSTGLGLALATRLVEAAPGRLVLAHTGANPRIDVILGLARRQERPGGPGN